MYTAVMLKLSAGPPYGRRVRADLPRPYYFVTQQSVCFHVDFFSSIFSSFNFPFSLCADLQLFSSLLVYLRVNWQFVCML